jgi:hypothetical protein
MKTLLASPGRAGKWSEFLRNRNIARATADRLANSYKKSLQPPNCILESIPESPEAAARNLVRKPWPKLRPVLASQELLYCFVAGLAAIAGGTCYDLRSDGVLVFRPAPEVVDPVPTMTPIMVKVGFEETEVI